MFEDDKDPGKFSHIKDSDMHDVGRFLNRLLGMPPEIQNRFAVFELNDLILPISALCSIHYICVSTGYLSYSWISWIFLFKMPVLKVTLTPALLNWKLMSLKCKGLQRFLLFSYASLSHSFAYVTCIANIKTGDNFPLMQTVYVDQMSGASTVLFTFILDRGVSWEVCIFFLTCSN